MAFTHARMVTSCVSSWILVRHDSGGFCLFTGAEQGSSEVPALLSSFFFSEKEMMGIMQRVIATDRWTPGGQGQMGLGFLPRKSPCLLF